MISFETYTFAAKGILSLAWHGEDLVDWVGGGRRFSSDGAEQRATRYYAYRFDSATTSPDGRFSAIYEKQGTKGLLLHDGKLVRELSRSFYFADAYEYPIVLFNDSHGRVLLAHCPQEYCRLEIEEAATGRTLTSSENRKPSDFFHSRLIASPNGKRLLSAGWVWHPWNAVAYFDVEQALKEPEHLDHGLHTTPSSDCEQGSACWLNDDTIVVGGTGDDSDAEGDAPSPEPHLSPRGFAIYDLKNGRCDRSFLLDDPPGTMWAIGQHHALSLYRNPKLIDLRNGKIVQTWEHLASGQQTSSITKASTQETAPPPMAFDAARRRFAIVSGDTITVIHFMDLAD